jgi:glycosyltransferase involved in cell wall biosynthesis
MALRVLQLNTLLRGGGTDDQCVKLSIGLHRAGIDVAIAGPADREEAALAVQSGVTLEDTGDEGFIKLRYIARVAGIIRRRRIDVVHAHHGRDYWPAILASRLSGRRPVLVLSRHLAKSPGSWPGRWLVLRLSDAVVACSEFVAQVLRHGHADPESPESERHWRPPMKGPHSRIRMIYGGSELDRFQPMSSDDPRVLAQRARWGLSPEDFVFGVVGGYALPRGKGQREFLAAAARIHREIPRARFVIVGRGDMGPLLEEDIRRLGLQQVASLPGHSSDMPVSMNAIDCLVHPQIGTEAMGLVVLEAHACGRPVVASSLDGIPEAFAFGGCGELVPPEDVGALADAMRRVALGARLSEADRQRLHDRVASRVSLSRYVGDTLALYRELLDARRSR